MKMGWIRSAFVLALTLTAAPLAAEERYEYDWLTIGEKSGSQRATVGDDGSLTIEFEFNDRGRGPATRTIVRLGEAGVPRYVAIRGLNYRKAPVDETFEWKDGAASWRSNNEDGAAPDPEGDALYIPFNAPPFYYGVIARALLDAPGRSLELLPSGQATIKRVKTITLNEGGSKQRLTLYAIDGLELLPSYVWLDEDRNFAGYDAEWFGILPAGWSGALPAIKTAQGSALDAHLFEFTKRYTHRVDGAIRIENAFVFNSETGERQGPFDVLVEDGIIASVTTPGSERKKAAFVKDATDKMLVPSLWDMHGHVWADGLANYAAVGVLNVRDMANNPERLAAVRANIGAGRLLGPDIIPMGFIDRKGPFSGPTGRLASSLDEALDIVDDYAATGHAGIKLYSSIDPAWVEPIGESAHAKGMTLLGHIPSTLSASEAIRRGYDEVTHVNMVLLEFLGDFTIDTRTPRRFTFPGEEAGGIDLSSDDVRRFINLMKAENIAHDPTAGVFMNNYRNVPGDYAPISAWFADALPVQLQRREISGNGYNLGKEAQYAAAADMTLKVIKLLHDEGVIILPGTDYAYPGFALLSELMFYKEAGISDAEILKLATLTPAQHMGVAERQGSIAPGKQAYMLLVDGDPTEDISELRNIELVFKGQSYYRSREINEALGINFRE